MAEAFEQRKHQARRMGEKAGTKLLVPLFLLLGVVMVMIMLPAWTAFGWYSPGILLCLIQPEKIKSDHRRKILGNYCWFCGNEQCLCSILLRPFPISVLYHSLSAKWRRMNFQSARRRNEAMRWHRRLTTTQQMEIQASHYAKCEWYSTLGRLVRYLVCPKKLSWRLNALLHVIESQSFTRNTDQRTRYDTNMCK